MWNLLKALNKDQHLEGLKSIDEVYDVQVNMFEEITNYHTNKEKIRNSIDKTLMSDNSSELSDMEDEAGPNLGNEKIKTIYNNNND